MDQTDVLRVIAFWALVYILIIVYGRVGETMIFREGSRLLYGLLAFGLAGAMGFLLGVLVGLLAR